MNNSRLVKISKYLSKHLRHTPDRLGIRLAPGGWVTVDEFLTASSANNFPIEFAELKEVVAKNDKQRFSFDSTGTLIRANQGHSVEVDLQLNPAVPPDILYHGTGKGAVESIINTGLCKMSRNHVHLSTDMETARKVGARHGLPVVFTVAAAVMYNQGYTFYCSENKVWLVDSVPSAFLKLT